MTTELSKPDLRILRYVIRHEPVDRDAFRKRFDQDHLVRLERLRVNDYIAWDSAAGPSAHRLISTAKGRNRLEDERWIDWLFMRNSVLLPIAVAFVTSVITLDLWPRCRVWLSALIKSLFA